MSAILPSINIDCDKKISKYFMPYQLAWIMDDSQMRLAEKSVRIGWTYGDAFKNVRKRLRNKNRDYLFTTKDQPTAFEYVATCEKFCEIFELTKSIVSRGVEDYKVAVFDDAGKATKFTEEIKVGYIKFDNGSRILAFSSNPNALRAYGGDVGWDEAAFHPDPEGVWASASGRVTWGYDLGLWSSHNGDDTLFKQFADEAAAGKGGWSYYRVTMPDAIELGLVEKINAVSGKKMSREQFLEDCKNRARLPEVFEQEYMCNPKGGTASIVPWGAIARCQNDYQIERLHLEEKQVFELFGEFKPEMQSTRETQISNAIAQAFAKLFGAPAKYRLGFDVAASGEGDLATIYIDEKKAGQLFNRALFTCRTEDWHFLKTVLFTFLRRLPALKACGDETGLGRQICWEAAKAFPNIFTSVNFASEKQDMGFALMNQLTVAEKRFPKSEQDIAADYFALRKTYIGKKWIFTEGRNTFNPNSHCDIAWAGALATKADASGSGLGALVG
jgi:phage FluMu gp28-like protein